MLDQMNTDNKIDVLISALEQRYDAMHKIRERVQNTGVWSLGIMSAIGGWLIQTDIVLSCLEKELYITGILVGFVVIRFHYLDDLSTGFKSQQRTAAKLEKALGFFTKKFFNDGDDTSIYPESWENAGTTKGEGKFFKTTYLLLYVGIAFLMITILLNGWLTPNVVWLLR